MKATPQERAESEMRVLISKGLDEGAARQQAYEAQGLVRREAEAPLDPDALLRENEDLKMRLEHEMKRANAIARRLVIEKTRNKRAAATALGLA